MTTVADTAVRAAGPRVADARRASVTRLVTVELRKTTDTRAGRWLLAGMGGLAVAALGYRLWNVAADPVTWELWFSTAMQPVLLLVPVLGVLAMTSEWTQRTALTTFTLVPQRGRVVGAKLVAALVLSTALLLGVAALTAAALIVGGAVDGSGVEWDDAGRRLAGVVVGGGLYVLMGAGFGALVQNTPLALVAYFVGPQLWNVFSLAVLGESGRWLDVWQAIGAVGDFRFDENLPQTVVALTAWVGLPLLLGVARALRREVQ